MNILVKYGLRSCLGLALLCSTVDFTWSSVASDGVANDNEDVLPGEMRVGQATKLCEKLIFDECVNSHARKYCVVMKKMVPACKKIQPEGENILVVQENLKVYQGLCKLKTDGSDRELQAQLKAQLMACIAAKRDPNARKTGRPEYNSCSTKTPIPWCSINSPSWREDVLYPDPEKVAKKDRYLNAKRDAENEGKTEVWIQKNIVLEKTLGQETEDKNEADICSGEKPVAECRSVPAAASSADKGG